jgi:hypothetical protein
MTLATAINQTRPWQCLNFLPEPQGQGELRPVPAQGARGPAGWPLPRDGAAPWFRRESGGGEEVIPG